MKTLYCHHCGHQIVWNRLNQGGGYFAHAILVHHGKAHTIENAHMEQRCANGRTWATPKREASQADDNAAVKLAMLTGS